MDLFAKINYIKERIGYKYLVLYFNYCKNSFKTMENLLYVLVKKF